MLSVASTRSSLTFDYIDLAQRSPSVKDAPISLNENTQQNPDSEAAQEPPSITPTDVVPNESELPVIVMPSGVEQNHTEPSLADGVAVADLDDQEFGGSASRQGAVADQSKESSESVIKVDDTTDEKLLRKSEDSPSQQHVEAESHLEDSENHMETPLSETKKMVPPATPEISVTLDDIKHIQRKDVKSPGVPPLNSVSPKVEKLDEKKGKTRGKGGRKFGRKASKERNKRSKTDVHDRGTDDNQSEMSYQPDTDLSRSKASRKINGIFCCLLEYCSSDHITILFIRSTIS